MSGRLCRKCGVIIAADWPHEYHVTCWPDFEAMPGFDMTSYDLEVKEDLIEIVLWAARHSKRSQQVALGVSEVGQECDLRLAYRMADMPAAHNGGDPWPAIVGTSIHTWMEVAIRDYQGVHGISEWFTEMEVWPSPLVLGHNDLYHASRGLILDWKFPGRTNMANMRKEGPSLQYRIQVQLYGLGQRRAGRKVERVGIAALGREGWLKDLYVHTEPFDEDMALKALDRIETLGSKMIALGLPESPMWQEIDRSPTRLCSWCPMWNRNETVPSSKGCPGR